jgi:hypothetical protein
MTRDKTDSKTSEPLYHVLVDADDCNMPTQEDPVPLSQVGGHIAAFLKRYEAQGYYSNARMQRLQLSHLRFKLERADTPPPAEAERLITGVLGADNVVHSDADGGL